MRADGAMTCDIFQDGRCSMGEKATYKWDAADYRDSSSQQKKWGRELLSKLILRGDERVLDIGCGDGALTAEIAARVPDGGVVGIDSSPEMIALAREAYPPEAYPNLSWEVMDARELAFDNLFDLAFSNAALHWVPDQLEVLRGVRRSLKQGGKTLFQMGGRGNASNVVRALAELLAHSDWGRYFEELRLPYRFCSPEEYTGWLREAGLVPMRVELIQKDMVHEGREGLEAWIRTTWLPLTQCIPEEKRDDFIFQLASSYLDLYPPDEEGLVHVNAVRLEVEAERA